MSEQFPILSQITIPEPCPVPWTEMTGDDRQRHCEQCDRTVFNLSNMTAPDAARVLQQGGRNLCVQIRTHRTDGRIRTLEDPPTLGWLRRLARRTFAVVGAMLMLCALGCAEEVPDDPPAEDDECWTRTGGLVG